MSRRSVPSQGQDDSSAGESGKSSDRDRPVMLRAIHATLRALEDRSRFYRNLIIAIVVVSGVSFLLAVIFLRWTPLLGLILLEPLVGGFLLLDSRRVRQWGNEILQMCRAEELDFKLFQQTITKFGHLPPNALESMLSTLQAGEKADEGTHSGPAAPSDGFDSLRQRQERRLLSATILLTLALSSLAAAALYRSVALLGCGVVLLVLFSILKTR
jgi:hypothetical protein